MRLIKNKVSRCESSSSNFRGTKPIKHPNMFDEQGKYRFFCLERMSGMVMVHGMVRCFSDES